ncbi:hypothetical protein EN817_25170 [Mesorhizobium sp. M3A.F.Ca.ET.174.01.1.1]|uniref:hypothetical protein n=1 Tax=unclassified Mesorhizobium TaxID=325217 RepID=UPI001093BC44|nr:MULTISPECIES: hypothetical protein [unclassified Mesorhizobium]TGS82735.1 hypothetical protein EN818_25220 [Mesorhizobium sp. M3A.F.Ca.ET.175.01.1.1]TGT22690.1 hypothetical protein EN817_25170 [Mesorhizobium sp. M3A.F.Ca.ET.174.01.1.1]
MLSILHPHVLPAIKSFAAGLLPIRQAETGKLSLVVKVSKEAILAARTNGGFSFYLAPMKSTTGGTVSLMTAFFDDEDEPLVIATGLFANDQHSLDLLELLTYKEADVFFFDEHSREWMSYRVTLHDEGSCLKRKQKFKLLEYHPATARSILDNLHSWFGNRTPLDDRRSIKVKFEEALAPEDIFVMDATPEHNDYLGSAGYRRDSLTREEPGYFQERDIASALRRVFKRDQIVINPLRPDTNKEILDVLVIADSHILLIQAKDSPNTEKASRTKLDRKRRKSLSQIDDAVRQIGGAARYLLKTQPAKLLIGGHEAELSIGPRPLVGIAVVKELFDDTSEPYVEACETLAHLKGGGMTFDYSSFHAFSHHFASEERFLKALGKLIKRVLMERSWTNPKDFIMDDILGNLSQK